MTACVDGKSEASAIVDVATASSNVSSVHYDRIKSQGTDIDSIHSLDTEWIEDLEPPPSTFVLNEGSLVEIAKRNGYTRMENEDKVTPVVVEEEEEEEDDDDDDDEIEDTDSKRGSDIFERRDCDEYIDFIRSSSSSVEDSTITNCTNQEDRTCRDEYDMEFERRVAP